MLTYEEFKKVVQNDILNYLPTNMKDHEVHISPYLKNNMQLDGLTILSTSSEGSGLTVSPVIYLNPYYEDYSNAGSDLQSTMENIARTYCEYKRTEPTQQFSQIQHDFDFCRDYICCSLIGRNGNTELLSRRPHIPEEDMAVIFMIDLEPLYGIEAVAHINSDISKKWGRSAEELYELALINTQRLHPATLLAIPADPSALGLFISEHKNIQVEDFQEVPDTMYYALSTSSKNRGAAAILYPGVKEKIHGEIGDFYIVPSSIHETLIIPVSTDIPADELQKICAAVNNDCVDPLDRLSSSIYKYDGKELTIAAPDPQQPKMEPKPMEPKPKKKGPKL